MTFLQTNVEDKRKFSRQQKNRCFAYIVIICEKNREMTIIWMIFVKISIISNIF